MGVPTICSFRRKLRLLVDRRRAPPDEVLDGEKKYIVGEEKAKGRERGDSRAGCGETGSFDGGFINSQEALAEEHRYSMIRYATADGRSEVAFV